MKLKVLIVSLFACLLLAGTAEAFKWHLGFGQAKHSSREFVEQACREDRECVGYGVGKCYRQSESRVDCFVGLFYEDARREEEVECDIQLHWGVSYSGVVELKNYGRPHCFPAG